ncbi:MAG TPA: CocE/NonD family hydrolase [Micropepsaceae bacterium]|nr:CocE/NonD family hydrolase [Micropepsaceae bacterium]
MNRLFSLVFAGVSLLAVFTAFLLLSGNMLAPLVAGMIGVPGRSVLLSLLAGCIVIIVAVTFLRRPVVRWSLICHLGLIALSLVSLVISLILFMFQGVQEEVVTFESNGVVITATLYVPDGEGPHPAIMIGHASGPRPRSVYDVYAYALAREGFAVLVADKRGVGESGGDFEGRDPTTQANLVLLAEDMVAGVRFLTAQEEVDDARVGVLGFSQSGWIAPLAAADEPAIRFMLLVTAPTTPSPAIHGRGLDPGPTIAALEVPVFWQFGANDEVVRAPDAIRVLEPLIARNKPITFKTYEGASHALIGAGRFLLPDISHEAWTDGVVWLKGQAGL